MTARLVPLLFAVACSRPPEPPRASAPGPAATLELFRDGAVFRTTRTVRFDRHGEARLLGVPRGDGLTLTTGGDALVVTSGRARVERGDRITVVTDRRSATGRFLAWTDDGAVLDIDGIRTDVAGPVRFFALEDANAAVRLGGGPPNATRELEVSAWLPRIRSHAAYTLVLDGDEPTAFLQGWLSIDANSLSAHVLQASRLIVVDGAREANSSRSRPTRVVVDRRVALAAGTVTQVPLVRGRRLPVRVSRVLDPLAKSLAHQGVVPVRQRGFSVPHGPGALPVSLTIEPRLSRSVLSGLPAGRVSLFSRRGESVHALGVVRAFGPPPTSGTEPLAKPDEVRPTNAIRIGVAPGLSARRWQEEFSLDAPRRRLVEEIRVELVNDGEEDAAITVIERMVRGLNWSLAYHNRAGKPSKQGPQEVRFATRVPAEGELLLMYRVVYTW